MQFKDIKIIKKIHLILVTKSTVVQQNKIHVKNNKQTANKKINKKWLKYFFKYTFNK